MECKIAVSKERCNENRYIDDLLNIDNPYFEGMVIQIYPPELQLNKDNNAPDTEAPFRDSGPFVTVLEFVLLGKSCSLGSPCGLPFCCLI